MYECGGRMKKVICLVLIVLIAIVGCTKKEKAPKQEPSEGEVIVKIYHTQHVPFSMILDDLTTLEGINFNSVLKNRVKPDPKTLPQVAFDLGADVADALIAVKAKNKDTLLDITKELVNYAEILNVSDEFLKLSDSLKILLDDNDWKKVETKIEEYESDVTDELYNLENFDSVILIQFGGWTRGLQNASYLIMNNFTGSQITSIHANKSVVNALLHDLPNISDEELLSEQYYQNSIMDVSKIKDIVYSSEDQTYSKLQVQELNKLSAQIVNSFK